LIEKDICKFIINIVLYNRVSYGNESFRHAVTTKDILSKLE